MQRHGAIIARQRLLIAEVQSGMLCNICVADQRSLDHELGRQRNQDIF